MNAHNLKATLAEAVRNPDQASHADIVTLLSALRTELMSFNGTIDIKDHSRNLSEIIDNRHNCHTLIEPYDFPFGSTIRIVGITVISQLRLIGDEIKSVAISLSINAPVPHMNELLRLEVSHEYRAYKPNNEDDGHSTHNYIPNGIEPQKAKIYSWSERNAAVRTFAELLVRFGAPAFSEQLRPSDPVPAHPLKRALAQPSQPQ